MRLLAAIGSVALALGLGSNTAQAVGVAAGTPINNTATVSYTVGATSASVSSNTVTVTVAEILDVVVTAQTPTVTVASGATQQVMRFLVTNTGNGSETFRLLLDNTIGGDQFDPVAASPSIYLDNPTTGTVGSLDAGDAQYVAGTNDPTLLQDAGVTVFVVNDIPGTAVDGNTGISRLSAESRTGTGAPGTTFPGLGAGGTDAVAGATGADSEANGQYLVASISITATKTQVVLDQFGGTRPVPGARITYSIDVSATGTGSATAVTFNDAIPANTTYVPGSLRLNTAVLSDGVDADAGSYETSPNPRVSVQLGTLTQAGGTQTIQFAVTID